MCTITIFSHNELIIVYQIEQMIEPTINNETYMTVGRINEG